MEWNSAGKVSLPWNGEISSYEEKKRIAAAVAGKAKNGDIIGFGSGSTSYLAARELGRRIRDEGLDIKAIPTSYEILVLCGELGIPVTTLFHSRPDWCFDGVDEIDGEGNMIKGRGGALFTEKLVMKSAGQIFILADRSKFVEHLGQGFPVPIEIHPNGLAYAKNELSALGLVSSQIRPAKGKDGPVITEHGNIILDARFETVSASLESELKSITGVIETGLFWGLHPEVLVVG